LVNHVLIRKRFNYLPESVAIIYIGGIFGLLTKIYNQWTSKDQESSTTVVQAASPLLNSNLFFMLFLPPIIFEQGYHLHKGNFFRNLGTISTFAIFGTTINALVTGAGLYLLGTINFSHKLPWRECFIIGSLNSGTIEFKILFYFLFCCLAIDPVAILSIFQVLNVDQLLYMLVFGESILNDAVAIVLTNVIVESKRQFENINTTKLTTYSMIGLLASSNLTTIPSVTNSFRHRNHNGLIEQNGQGAVYESKGNIPSFFSNDDNDRKYPLTNNVDDESNEPVIPNDYIDDKNIPARKKKRQSNFSQKKTMVKFKTFYFSTSETQTSDSDQ
jgi:hypothetical protein